MVYLGGVEGEFRLPYPRPDRLLFISAGSGVTPIWSMVRNLAQDTALADAKHVHCCRDPDDFIFGETLRGLAKKQDGYHLHEHHSTKEEDRLSPEDLDDLFPDWKDREAFLSGPPEMLEAMKDRWEADGDPDRLHLERFQPVIGGEGTKEAGAGGTVRFRVTEVEGESDGKTPILECGENAGAKLPFGCRMGGLPHLRGQARAGQGPRPPHRQGPRRRGSDDPHLRERSRGPRRDGALNDLHTLCTPPREELE